MRFKQIKLSPDSEPIDNPNYIDCPTPEDAVAIQFVFEWMNIQYDLTVFRYTDGKMRVRYFTDAILTPEIRKQIDKMKLEAGPIMQVQMGPGYYSSVEYIKVQMEAADKKYKELGL